MPKGIFKRTKKHRENISKALKGKPKSLEHKENLSKNHYNVNGENNPNWKGGRRKVLGYWLIWKPNHPFVRKDGYIYEHRLIMEKKLRRYLRSSEYVHHKNGKKDDNRENNLELFFNSGNHLNYHLGRMALN